MKCEICEIKEPLYTCKMCGRRVCDDDYDKITGYCLVCKDAICKICNRYLSIGVCKYCGRLGCERCLIQVSPIEYTCVDCRRKELK
ncbi:MAG: hypothetical protein QXG15_04170 [Desulfurococcaceae archaeon]